MIDIDDLKTFAKLPPIFTAKSFKAVNSKLKKFFTIAALVFFGAATASVQFTDEPKYEVHVESIKTVNGDTLWQIAEHYRNLDDRDLYIFEYIDELRELNPFLVERKNQLNVGDVIEVKYYTRFQNRKQ